MISIVRARSASNKLEIFDNRLFAIDIKLLAGTAFRVYFIDLLNGEKYIASYKDRKQFNCEWEIVNNEDVQLVKYDIINYYME